MRTRRTIAARPRPRQHNYARDGVPDAGGDERWNGFNRVADGEVGRTPDEIDGGEGERQLYGVGAAANDCGFFWRSHEHGSASDIFHLNTADLRRFGVCHHLTSKIIFRG